LKRQHWLTILGTFAVLWFAASVSSGAERYVHTVQKGDTLWDICEKYYGDEDLWPKLWEMNPFITNPHLLKPGDVISLLEDHPMKLTPTEKVSVKTKEEAAAEEKPVSVKEAATLEKTEPEEAATPEEAQSPSPPQEGPLFAGKGIDVSGLTNVDALGFLASVEKEIESWGHISYGKSQGLEYVEGDTVYVSTGKEVLNPGDEFTICRKSPLLKHPLTNKRVGYLVSHMGRLVIRELMPAKEQKQKKAGMPQLYRAEILQSFRGAHLGDFILPYQHMSACVQPVPVEQEISANIVAIKDRQVLLGEYWVVYLDKGHDHGIRRGHLFEVLDRKRGTEDQVATLPALVLGHVLVLGTTPSKATGVIVDSRQEFLNGSRINGLDRQKVERLLPGLPRCQ